MGPESRHHSDSVLRFGSNSIHRVRQGVIQTGGHSVDASGVDRTTRRRVDASTRRCVNSVDASTRRLVDVSTRRRVDDVDASPAQEASTHRRVHAKPLSNPVPPIDSGKQQKDLRNNFRIFRCNRKIPQKFEWGRAARIPIQRSSFPRVCNFVLTGT